MENKMSNTFKFKKKHGNLASNILWWKTIKLAFLAFLGANFLTYNLPHYNKD